MQINLRTEESQQGTVYVPRGFEGCTARELRQDGTVFTYTRKDNSRVALSFENEPGRYVVWTLHTDGHGYTTFESRTRAIAHAIHCATVVYRKDAA